MGTQFILKLKSPITDIISPSETFYTYILTDKYTLPVHSDIPIQRFLSFTKHIIKI